MIKLLLASHGDLAYGVYSSLKIIMGEQKNISTLCAYNKEDFDLKKEVWKIINDLKDDDKVNLIPSTWISNNEFMNNLYRDNLYLVSGLNLPLVMELMLIQDESNIDSMIQNALETSIKTIKYCNPIIKAVEVEEEF